MSHEEASVLTTGVGAVAGLQRPTHGNDPPWRRVLRPAGPWTPAVHALLRHLEQVGFSAAPRVVGDGYDDQGREVLTWIPGRILHPRPYTEEQVWQVGRLLRSLHEATASFRPPLEAVWQPWTLHSRAPEAIISHCNVGPWHVIVREEQPVGLIDWSLAGPTDRLDELAVSGWWNAQLHDDDIAAANGLADAAGRAEQLRSFWMAMGCRRRIGWGWWTG